MGTGAGAGGEGSEAVPTVPVAPEDRSYRALLRVPTIGRVLLGMEIARIAQSMIGIAMVLFTLDRFHSPVLAGLVTFASTFPGIVTSPVAGALLDRHGRTRLVTLNYVVAAIALFTMAWLAGAGLLSEGLLLLIAASASLTAPLSTTGLRTLFPIIVPRPLWERANAADSVGYVAAALIGAPLAGLAIGVLGPELALAIIATVFAIAALVVVGIPDPIPPASTTGRLMPDAWLGLVYTLKNPTLRALIFSISSVGLAGGVTTIMIPLIVLDRLHAGPAAVGLVIAFQGIGGVLAALFAGRFDTLGRERRIMVRAMAISALVFSLLLPDLGPMPVLAAVLILGILGGPIDIAMFTLRQRRTDRRWIGRAFAVSMALNSLGTPIGAAIAGSLAGASFELAIAVGIVGYVLGAVFAYWLLPDVAGEEVRQT